MIRTEAKAKPTQAPKPWPADHMIEAAHVAISIAQAVHVGRGRPSSGRVVISLRLDPAVIAKFKATGKGWQSRINDALKDARV